MRAHLPRRQQPLEPYPWSSCGQYLKAPRQRVGWLRTERLLGEWGMAKDSPAGRKHFARRMEHRRRQEDPKTEWKAIEHGWFLGRKEFKQELRAQMGERRGDHYGPELREADVAHAQGVLKEELSRRGGTEAELSRRRKGNPGKVELASLLSARAHDIEMDRATT